MSITVLGKGKGSPRGRERCSGKSVVSNGDTRDDKTVLGLQNSRIPVSFARNLIIAEFRKIPTLPHRGISTPWGCKNDALGSKSARKTS